MKELDFEKIKGKNVKNTKAFKKHNASTPLKNPKKVQAALLKCIVDG